MKNTTCLQTILITIFFLGVIYNKPFENCSDSQYDLFLKRFNLPQSEPTSQEYQ